MKPAQLEKSIRVGSLSLAIRRYADGRCGFDYTPPGEKRVKVRLQNMDAAERRAREIIGIAHGGKVERLAINEGEYAEFLRWQAERKRPAPVPELVAQFLASKRSKGIAPPTLRSLQSALKGLAAAFPCPIGDLIRARVERWMDSRNLAPRSWNNLRAAIIALHRHARHDGLLAAELTAVERMERRKVSVKVETYTPSELRRLIDAVAVISPEWIPMIAIGAFCGVRPEELLPDERNGGYKPRLRWENVLWSKAKLDVPADVAKDRRRRFVPLCKAVLAWLAPFRKSKGSIVPHRLHRSVKARWLETADLSWKKDALRHSYASYRIALTQNMPALALEMGNSIAMIHRHYLDLQHASEARKWFAIFPGEKTVPKVPSAPSRKAMNCNP